MALATNIKFVKEAISVEKWAFAADVIRLYALYTEGGIYMDADIAVRSRFDHFMNDKLVLFQEYHLQMVKKTKTNKIDKNGYNLNIGKFVTGIGIQAAFMMSEKGHPFVKTLLSHYENRNFIRIDGTYDVDVIAPAIYASYAEKIGYRYMDEIQKLDNITIYPSKYISSSYYEINKDSFSLHCCAHSWFKPSFIMRVKRIIKKFFNMNTKTNVDIVNDFLYRI